MAVHISRNDSPCWHNYTAPELLRCTYISLSAVNSELEYIPAVHHLSVSELFRV